MGVRGRKNRNTSRSNSRKKNKKTPFEKKNEQKPKSFQTFSERVKSKKPTQKIKFAPKSVSKDDDGKIRLNKFIANAGICSRREADEMIKLGIVTVNGKIIQEVGTKVATTDVVTYDGSTIRPEKKQYILLNKPKNVLNVFSDPKGRKTVSSIVSKACKEDVFPVGKLDKLTTGVVLLTNDNDLIKKLTHPKNKIQHIYHIVLQEKVNPKHLDMLREGIELDDGFFKVEEVAFVKKSEDRHHVGVELYSGRNNIVRRLFEYFGYNISKIDRVNFAGLTKKDLPRGKYRPLDNKEIGFLKMM